MPTDPHDPLAQIAKLPLHQEVVFLQQPEFARWHMALDAAQRIVEPRSRNHEIAHEAHQIVEPGEIDSNEVARRGRRHFPGPWP